MKKYNINFYTYYQIFDHFTGSQQSIISKKIKELTENLEKELNKLHSQNSLNFKIYFDIVDNNCDNINHYNDFIKKNNINVVCQAPNYFKTKQWSDYFENAIYFDSFGFLKNSNHPNLFHTPISGGIDHGINQIKNILNDHEIISVLCFENKIKKFKFDKYEDEVAKNGTTLKIINNWKENNFENVKSFFSSLNENQVVFHTRFIDENEKIANKGDYRSDFVKVFLDTRSNGILCGNRLDARMLHDCFNSIKNKNNNKILNFVGDDFVEKIEIQDRILTIDSDMPKNINEYLNWYFQIIIDKVLLFNYIYSDFKDSFLTTKDFLKESRKKLSKLDGDDDFFLGPGEIIYFEKNSKPHSSNFLTEVDSSSNNLKSFLYKQQNVSKKGSYEIANVNYPNFDFLKINNISIEEGIFDASFYFELTTRYEEGIEILRFNNATHENFESKLIKKEMLDDDYYYFRYYISSTFTFNPYPENYPFDKQMVFISFSLVDNDKYGLVQTIKSQDVDRHFITDGWKVLGFRSGIIRKKDHYNPVFKKKYIRVSEENRIGTILSRPNSFTVAKILIPLVFLAFLALFGTYLPFDELETIIALTTASFLSAIALYFSTERPNPLSLTTIDLIFLLFYFFVGIILVAIFVLGFFPEYYVIGLSYTRWVLLFFTIFSCLYIYKRVKSFFPTMKFDGAES